MVEALLMDNDSRTEAEMLIAAAKQISGFTPPASARNSIEDPASLESDEPVNVEDLDEEMMIIVDENRVPAVAGEEEVIDVGKNDDHPLTPSSISDAVSLHCSLSPSFLASASPSLTVAGAVAGDKARQRAIALMIENYVEKAGGNLYPTREEKEKMAEDLELTYIQINRWFANRRRKVTKHRKILGCSSPVTAKGGEERGEGKVKDNMDECIDFIIEETRRKRKAEADIEAEMVAHKIEGVPAAAEDRYVQEQEQMAPPPPGASATAAILAAALAQGNNQISPYLIASILSSPAITAHLLQQVMQQQALHAQMQQLYASQAAIASPLQQHHHHQLMMDANGQAQWMSPPVSESPQYSDHASDFSPRPCSPRFKDPHNIADPQMAKLLAATDLSEKESIAIAVLTEMLPY